MSDKIKASDLKKYLICDPDRGVLFWKHRPREMFTSECSFRSWNTKYAGREAFTSCDSDGYRQGKILGFSFRAHRVIWAMKNGEWPKVKIDHFNCIRIDNRIENLRLASDSENVWNRKVSKSSTSGIKGVYFDRRRMKWRARIKYNCVNKHLGDFSSIEEAAEAYARASVKYHGKFSRF